MPECLLGLGSNLGDRSRQLDLAVERIGAHPEIEVVAVSRYHTTVPIGGPAGQGEFLNAALRMQTSVSAEGLLDYLLQVETGLQRRRTERWGARTIDLDILLYGQTRVRSPHLILPHPRMVYRRFVLEPAAEIASDMVHPELGWTVAKLLQHLNSAVPYVAVTGLPKAGKTSLAEAVASRCAARLVRDPLGATGNPVGTGTDLDVATHLEILERRVRLLQPEGPGGDPSESISDFWLDQTRAHAESWLSHAGQVRYRERHDEAGRGTVTPKLLVLLGMDPQESVWRLKKSEPRMDGWDEHRLAELERRIGDLALRPERQPVLRVRSEHFAEAVEEVVAAMETMR